MKKKDEEYLRHLEEVAARSMGHEIPIPESYTQEGEWRVVGQEARWWRIVTTNQDGGKTLIAEVPFLPNANLIAAAPRLHKALKEAKEFIAELKQTIKGICEDEGLTYYGYEGLSRIGIQIDEALAKVEGQ